MKLGALFLLFCFGAWADDLYSIFARIHPEGNVIPGLGDILTGFLKTDGVCQECVPIQGPDFTREGLLDLSITATSARGDIQYTLFGADFPDLTQFDRPDLTLESYVNTGIPVLNLEVFSNSVLLWPPGDLLDAYAGTLSISKVPEPSSVVLVFLALIPFAPRRLRRTQRRTID